MLSYVITIALLLIMLCGWLWLRRMAREFALAHPEFGAHREEGHGCGGCPEGGCSGHCRD